MDFRSLLFLAFVMISSIPSGWALETDQFLTWNLELRDSTSVFNEYVNQEVEGILEKINDEYPYFGCEETTHRIFKALHLFILSAKARSFLGHSPEVDRHPGPEVNLFEYWNRSIFRKPAPPTGMIPMGRTVRLNDVYLGTDKMGHFLGRGSHYYEIYRHAIKRGKSVERALEKTLEVGLKSELFLLGKMSDGVFSNADLEANYQGLLFALDLCESRHPHLERDSQGKWTLARTIDMRNYLPASLDESFTLPYFARWRWKLVEPILTQEYCELYYSPRVQARFLGYRKRLSRSPVAGFTERFFKGHPKKAGIRFTFEELCGRSTF